MGETVREITCGTWMGKSDKLGMLMSSQVLFLSVHVDDIKMAGRKKDLAPMWKKLIKNVDIEEPTSFLDHVYFGCTQRECKPPNDTIIEQYKKMFESRISAGATEKIAREPRSKVSAWSCDMEGHARKCVERFCELSNKKTEQLHKVSSPCLDGHQIKKEALKNTVNCHKFAHMLSLNACTWQELVDKTFCGQSINWPDLSRNGHNLVTDDWRDEFPTFITHVIAANIVMWVMRRNIVDQGSSKTPILQEILKTPNQHSYRSVECARSEPQYLTALQNLKSFRWMLVCGWKVYPRWNCGTWQNDSRIHQANPSMHAGNRCFLQKHTQDWSSVKCK